MTAFSLRAGDMGANDVGGREGGRSCATAAVQDQSGHLAPTVAPETIEDSVPTLCFPRSNGAGSGVSGAREAAIRGFPQAVCRGTEQQVQCLESIPPRVARASSVASPRFSNRCPLEVQLDEERCAVSDIDGVHVGNVTFAGVFAARPKAPLTTPAGLRKESREGREEDDVAAEDWLEVSHALLDESNKSC